METTQADLVRPLLEDEERAILEGWNASVAAFVAENGGADNENCYCESIAHPESNDENTESISTLRDHGDSVVVVDAASLWRVELAAKLAAICTSTLLPDGETMSSEEDDDNESNDSTRHHPKQPETIDSAIKFLKFVCLTIASIALVQKTVAAASIGDRDTTLTLHEIILYEGDSILRDLLFFFVVGKMHRRSGVDTLEWIGFGILANLYFESQTLVSWMQHSATPYEMHCLWPWQLWVFAIGVVTTSIGLGIAHAVVAHRQHKLWRMLGEIFFCFLAFIVPVALSPYAHFHHWFAGWFLGMHTNLHEMWWSRASMAYCWGMYINGIAVYGRDPLLTCDYARFLARDQGCPMLVGTEEDSDIGTSSTMYLLVPLVTQFFSDDPPDWRNCTNSGYHP